jgi:hypothetical protein
MNIYFSISLLLVVNIVPFNCNHTGKNVDEMTKNLKSDGPLTLALQNGIYI